MRQPALALYYNDQDPATIFYQGLALRRLGREAQARRRFSTLVDFARRHRRDPVEIDYFAVSLPEFLVFDDDLELRQRVHCRYLLALGTLGLGRGAVGLRHLRAVLRMEPSHQPARLQLRRFAEGSNGAPAATA